MEPSRPASVHWYPAASLLGDYARSVIGLAVSAVPMAMLPSRPLTTYVFGGLVGLFVLYLLRTAMRQFTRIEAGDESIAVNLPLRRAIAWRDVDRVRLRYYSTKRGRKSGWLTLVVGGRGQSLSMESTMHGFRDLARRAVDVAARNGIALDETTAANLAALETVAEKAGP